MRASRASSSSFFAGRCLSKDPGASGPLARVDAPPIPRRIASSKRLFASASRCEKPCLFVRSFCVRRRNAAEPSVNDPRLNPLVGQHSRSFAIGAGLCMQRVFGPSVFGVAATKVFSHLVIRRRPEAAQVAGDLDGAIVRAEEMEQHGHAAASDAGRFCPAEQLLKLHREDRRPVWFVRESSRPPAGKRQCLGCAFTQLAAKRGSSRLSRRATKWAFSTSSRAVLPWQIKSSNSPRTLGP